jgi:hypothetical protein
MSKFASFSITDLRSLQNVISSYVENIRGDVVTEDGEILSASVSEEQAEDINADAFLQESLLSQLLEEMESRLACATTAN